jgi:hypothetical protein
LIVGFAVALDQIIFEGDAMIGQVTLTKIPVSAEPTAKTLPGYNYELRNSADL